MNITTANFTESLIIMFYKKKHNYWIMETSKCVMLKKIQLNSRVSDVTENIMSNTISEQ